VLRPKFSIRFVTVACKLFQMKQFLRLMEENMYHWIILATIMEPLVAFTAFCSSSMVDILSMIDLTKLRDKFLSEYNMVALKLFYG
jgi:hypothetical protein